MKFPLLAVALACGVCLSACDDQNSAPPRSRAKSTPLPKDELDAGTNRLKAKTESTLAAVENYFVGQSPKARKEWRRTEEKFIRDKAKWREKLVQEQKDLQPQIDRLKEQLEKLDTSKNRDQLRAELSRLQDRSKETDRLRSKLEAAGRDIWHEFKAELTAQEAGSGTPPPTP